MLRVGHDIALVSQVRDAVAAHGDRYLTRVFTAEELEECGGEFQRLATRFAAKEATLKVLRLEDDAIPWTDIGTRRRGGGWVDLVLTGAAAELAIRAGLHEFSLSMSHEGDLASAVVIAQGTTTPSDD